MKAPLVAAVLATTLAGCSNRGELQAVGQTVGVSVVRTACPEVAVLAGTGDLTSFDPATSTDASALDVVASLTNLRSTCDDSGEQIASTISFDVEARRTRTDGARDVMLPFFLAVVRGGKAITAKQTGQVAVHFDAGQARATGQGRATSYVSRAAATLPDAIKREITRRRKPGREDAAVDPLTKPEVRRAVESATFEALVGFQLTDAQLRYNATR